PTRRSSDLPWRKLLGGGRFLNLVLVRGLLRRLLHSRLSRRGHFFEQLSRLAHGIHRPFDDVHRYPSRPQRVFERFRHALERRRARRPLGVLGFQEFDVVEHLVRLVVGERVELPHEAVTQDLVHGRLSRLIMSSTGLPRNRVRPVRTRAVTWMVASGVSVSSWTRFASGTTTYTNPRSGSGPRARKYVAPFGISGRSSSAFCVEMNCSVQRSTCPA